MTYEVHLPISILCLACSSVIVWILMSSVQMISDLKALREAVFVISTLNTCVFVGHFFTQTCIEVPLVCYIILIQFKKLLHETVIR